MKRFVSLALCLMLALAVMTGAAMAEQEVFHVVVFEPESDQILTEDPIIQYVEERFGMEFEFISPSWSDNTQVLKMLIAGDETPDMISSQICPGSSDFTQLVEDEILLDITDYLESGDYPNLVAYIEAEPTFELYKYEGRWYGIPQLFDSFAPHGLQYRADWLKELGLEEPTNFDELYEVLKAVVAADPDGTGTNGLSLPGPWWLSHFMANFMGTSTTWSKVEDRWVQYYTLDGYKEFLTYFNKLYTEGLLDRDFILGTDGQAQEKFISGRAFMINYNVDPAIFAITAEGLATAYPDAEIGFMAPIEGPGGRYSWVGQINALGMSQISADCECPERILAFWDFICSEEGQFLCLNGLEGLHYTIDGNGEVVKNQEAFDADTARWSATWADGKHFVNRLLDYSYSYLINPNDPNFEALSKESEIRHSYPGLPNANTYQFTSENQVDYGSNVDTVVSQWQIAFISGEKSVADDWDAYLAELADAGYYKIEDDMNAWMAEHE